MGFTLIELLVVIAVLGVLTTTIVLLINPKRQIDKANDSRRRSELKQIQTALELYRSDVGSYPTVVGDLGTSLVNPTDPTIIYIQSVPKDPSGLHYYYNPISGGNRYAIIACSQEGTPTSDPGDVFDSVTGGAMDHFESCKHNDGNNYYIRYQSP